MGRNFKEGEGRLGVKGEGRGGKVDIEMKKGGGRKESRENNVSE